MKDEYLSDLKPEDIPDADMSDYEEETKVESEEPKKEGDISTSTNSSPNETNE